MKLLNKENILPKDWKWVKLGEVCKLKNGFAFKSNEYKSEGIPVIRISDIKSGSVKPDKSVRVDTRKDYEEYVILENEILVAMSGATTGKFGIFKSKEKAYQNQRVGKFQVLNKENLDNAFLLYQLHALKRQIEKDAYGGAQPNISSGKIEAMEILLPPKPTQLAIVSKIEELFSELDKGIEQLKTAQLQLKTYRQAVLKAAFEGRLNHDLSDLNDSADAANHTNHNNQKNHSADNGELPKGWKWVKFGELFSENPQNGLYKSSTEYGSGTPIIRIDGFYDGSILNDYQYKRVRLTDEEIRRYLISIGDILVNRVNSMPYLGKCGLVKHLNERTVFESNIMKIRINREIALPEYFTLYLSSKKGITELRKNAKQAVNQASINQTDVSNVMIPLPPIEQQHLIVQEIESRLSVADKMEESIIQSLQQAEALRQSILKKAFEGKLVTS